MEDKPKLASSSPSRRLDPLRAIKGVLFPKEELLKYDLSKTAVELARLTNEIKGYVSELESDFSKCARFILPKRRQTRQRASLARTLKTESND